METFLGKTASYIIENHEEIISKLCIVLPNRRASLFLRKQLSLKLNKVSWSPQIYSIEDFIFKLSGSTILDHTSLLFELYEIHKIIAKDKTQEFEEFTKWGQVLLHDFNEIDQHLAQAKSLFNYLSDIKSLSNWNPQQQEPTDFQKQYISFFQSLFLYYEALNKRLSKVKASYPGRAYRFVAENIHELIKESKWAKIIFAGFNALTTSEEKIIFDLEQIGVAEVLWDVDDYYLQKSEAGIFQEAGFFIRKYLAKHKEEDFNWIENYFQIDTKNIHIYGVPKQIGQAKLCGQILVENPDILGSKHNSAVVLADENLLFPILNSLPNIKELNATMGIPLNSTPAYDLIKLVLDMHQKSFMFQKMKQKSNNTHHSADILKILSHPILMNVCEELFKVDVSEYRNFIDFFSKSNKVFHTERDIYVKLERSQIHPVFFNLIFSDWVKNIDQTLKYISGILEHLRDSLIQKQKKYDSELKIELEYIYQLSIVFTKIFNYQSKYNALKNIKSLNSFFKQLCKTEKLSLYGEPLQGLQLMGMLETRTLDFENLILCSLNENILPGSGKQNSFIPFDIRREYDLPTYREKNAIFAYHFFRLIQRAKNIHLIYNTEADPISGGDKSRFLYQLQEEFIHNPNITIKEEIVNSPLITQQIKKISVEKTTEIIDILKEKALKGFSPSSLNTYKRCSLQFYFKEVAKLGEPNNNKEIIDAATLGQIIHEVLQQIFEPLVSQKVDVNYLTEKLTRLDSILQDSFDNLYVDGNVKSGKNLLISKVANRFIRNYLKHEIRKIKAGASIFIRSLEKNYSVSVAVNQEAFPKGVENINFRGVVDRIDLLDGKLRIIDYKTGNVKKSDLAMKDWDSLFNDHKTDKSFQLVFYAWLYYKYAHPYEAINPGIYSLKKLSEDFIELKTPNGLALSDYNFDNFEASLLTFIEDIYDQNTLFKQTDEIKVCSYCDYKIICNR